MNIIDRTIFGKNDDFDKNINNTDEMIMNHIDEGIPFFLETIKKYNVNTSNNEQTTKYLNNYLRVFLDYNLNISYIDDDLYELHNELIICNFLNDIKYLWLHCLYANLSTYIDTKDFDISIVFNFLNCTIFRKYAYKKEIECKGLNLEKKTIICKLIRKYTLSRETPLNKELHQLGYFMVMNKDYIGKSFIIELSKKIYKENKIRDYLRDNILNSNQFLFNLISILNKIWFKLYQFNTNIKDILEPSFTFYYIKLIEISLHPILENLKYYKAKFDELDEISIQNSRLLIKEKMVYKKKIVKLENFLNNRKVLITNIFKLYIWISKLVTILDRTDKELKPYANIFENCFYFLLRLQQCNIDYECPFVKDLQNICLYYAYSKDNLYLRYVSFCLCLTHELDMDDIYIKKYIELIIDLNDNETKISFREKIYLINKSVNIDLLLIANSEKKKIDKYVDILLSDCNRLFNIIKDKVTFFIKNPTLIKNETITVLDERLTCVNNIINQIFNLFNYLKISDFSNLFFSINHLFQFNLLTINKIQDFDKKQILKKLMFLPHLIDNLLNFYQIFINDQIFLKKIDIEDKDSIKSSLLMLDKDNIKVINILVNLDCIKENIKYPDEFCDPLLFHPIEDPVVLPNSDIIIDRITIEKHLINNDYNPFNMEKLTLEELNTFNNLTSTIDVIKKFLDKKLSWLTKQEYM